MHAHTRESYRCAGHEGIHVWTCHPVYMGTLLNLLQQSPYSCTHTEALCEVCRQLANQSFLLRRKLQPLVGIQVFYNLVDLCIVPQISGDILGHVGARMLKIQRVHLGTKYLLSFRRQKLKNHVQAWLGFILHWILLALMLGMSLAKRIANPKGYCLSYKGQMPKQTVTKTQTKGACIYIYIY